MIYLFFSQLFGEDDPDQDVSPDTADPELAGMSWPKHDTRVGGVIQSSV